MCLQTVHRFHRINSVGSGKYFRAHNTSSFNFCQVDLFCGFPSSRTDLGLPLFCYDARKRSLVKEEA